MPTFSPLSVSSKRVTPEIEVAFFTKSVCSAVVATIDGSTSLICDGLTGLDGGVGSTGFSSAGGKFSLSSPLTVSEFSLPLPLEVVGEFPAGDGSAPVSPLLTPLESAVVPGSNAGRVPTSGLRREYFSLKMPALFIFQ